MYTMCSSQCVLALLALYVGLAHSFSWDIVVAGDRELEFMTTNPDQVTDSVLQKPFHLTWNTYDPVHNRVLFAKTLNTHFVYSYNMATQETEIYTKKTPSHRLNNLAYDPDSELLFGTDKNSLYSFLLKPWFKDHLKGNLIVNLENKKASFRDVAVDRCGRYIYWITDSNQIERARFNGAEREVVIGGDNVIRQSLAIDAQNICWIEKENDYNFVIQSADLQGKNRIRLYSGRQWVNGKHFGPERVAVSKDFIYWWDNSEVQSYFWELPRHPSGGVQARTIQFKGDVKHVAIKIDNQTQSCETVDKTSTATPIVVRSTTDNGIETVSGKSDCECEQDYDEVSVCHNYCFRGDCSLSAEGQPKCRCNAGYSGDRCEANACQAYCLNSGVCSLNEAGEPVCQCAGHYQGDRCEVPDFVIELVQTVSLLKNLLETDVTSLSLGKGVKPTCASTVV